VSLAYIEKGVSESSSLSDFMFFGGAYYLYPSAFIRRVRLEKRPGSEFRPSEI